MVANNMTELNNMLMNQLITAMNDASVAMYMDTQKEVDKF